MTPNKTELSPGCRWEAERKIFPFESCWPFSSNCEINWAVGNLSYGYGSLASPPNNNHLLSSIDRWQLFYQQCFAHSSRPSSIVWLEFLTLHFAVEETVVQRGKVICWRPLSWEVTELDVKSVYLMSGLGPCCSFVACFCVTSGQTQHVGPECFRIAHGLGQSIFIACPPTVSIAPHMASYPHCSPSFPRALSSLYNSIWHTGCGRTSVPPPREADIVQRSLGRETHSNATLNVAFQSLHQVGIELLGKVF